MSGSWLYFYDPNFLHGYLQSFFFDFQTLIALERQS